MPRHGPCAVLQTWRMRLGIPVADATHGFDSCPNQPGDDELGNYISYTHDVCIVALGHTTQGERPRTAAVQPVARPVVLICGRKIAPARARPYLRKMFPFGTLADDEWRAAPAGQARYMHAFAEAIQSRLYVWGQYFAALSPAAFRMPPRPISPVVARGPCAVRGPYPYPYPYSAQSGSAPCYRAVPRTHQRLVRTFHGKDLNEPWGHAN
jgi:hypothetical protein